MLYAALLGGLFVGVLSALPFVKVANCCCLWIFSGGLLAAWVLQQNEDQPIGGGRGALVGCLAGVIGAFVWLVVAVAIEPIVGPLELRMLESMAPNAADLPPQVQEMLDSMSDSGSAVLRFTFEFVGQLFTGAMFSTLGGFIGSSIFRPTSRAVPPPLPPPI